MSTSTGTDRDAAVSPDRSRIILEHDNYELNDFLSVAAGFGSKKYGFVATPNVDGWIRFRESAPFRAAYAQAAYVLLDKEKPLAAIDTFRRALAIAPSFAPALFGLVEAYRHEGEPVQAIAAYRKYLESSPGGAYAPAARAQIRELESKAPPPTPQRPPELPPPTQPPPQ